MGTKINILNKIWLRLLSLGPGIFCIGYTIGTRSVTSMIKSGSEYGLQLLWVLALSAFFAWVLMESYGRFAAVTGITVINGFKNRLKAGKFWAILIIIGVVLGQWSALSGILGLTSNAIYEIFRLFFPRLNENNYWAILGIAAMLIIIMYTFLLVGRYSFFEKILVIFVTLMGISFILSMFIVIPDPKEIIRGFVPVVGANPPMAQIITQVVSVFILPVVIMCIIILINKEKLMGKHKANLFLNIALFAAFGFSLVISYTGMLGLSEYFIK